MQENDSTDLFFYVLKSSFKINMNSKCNLFTFFMYFPDLIVHNSMVNIIPPVSSEQHFMLTLKVP